MPKLKANPPCTGFEFAVRRRACGLDNATLMQMTGCSISSATKWSSGAMPVSNRAYIALEKVEKAVEEAVQTLVDTNEVVGEHGEAIALRSWDPNWEYGDASYEIVVARARLYLEAVLDGAVMIMPGPDAEIDGANPYFYSVEPVTKD